MRRDAALKMLFIIVFKRGGDDAAGSGQKTEFDAPAQFEQLAEVPPEEEWLANLTNAKTRRAYKNDVGEFIAFTGLHDYGELRSVVRSHIIGWRKDMERRDLEPATIRRKLSALSSLFDYLCERNAVVGNPVDGVKRPMANGNEGSTPALGRPAGTQAPRSTAGRHAQGRARPGHSGDLALSRYTPRRVSWTPKMRQLAKVEPCP